MALGIFSRGRGGELKAHYRVDLFLTSIKLGVNVALARDSYRGFGVFLPSHLPTHSHSHSPSPCRARLGYLD